MIPHAHLRPSVGSLKNLVVSRATGTLVAVLLLFPAMVQAQDAPPAAPPAAAPSGEIKVPVPSEQDLTPPTYTYEIGGRRDPFRSLLLRDPNKKDGPRPEGLPGMLVDELELQGTIRTKAGWLAMMKGADNKSYLVRKGNTVFDGEVIDITGTEITFRQNVNDPTNPKPFRDVVKALSLANRKP